MAKQAQVLIRVEEDQKKKWQQHAESEDKYRSLTNMIEQSVEARIAEDTQEWTMRDELGELLQLLEQQQQRSERIEELAEQISERKADNVKIEEEAQSVITSIETRLERLEERLQDDE